MRQKSLSIHGDSGDFTVFYTKSYLCSIRQVYFAVYGENDDQHKIKAYLSRRIFDLNQTNFRF